MPAEATATPAESARLMLARGVSLADVASHLGVTSEQALALAQSARNALAEANLRLAGRFVQYLGWVRPSVEDDVFQQARLGILDAAARFDPEIGRKFSTFAWWWMRAHVGRWLKRRRRTRLVDLHDDTLRHIIDRRKDSRPAWEDREELESRLAPVRKAMRRLSPRQREVLLLRAEGLTQAEVGARLIPPVCKERVRQIEYRAVAKVRKVLGVEVG